MCKLRQLSRNFIASVLFPFLRHSTSASKKQCSAVLP